MTVSEAVSSRVKFAQRVLTGTLLILLSAAVLFFGTPLLFSLEVVAFAALALHEFFALLKGAGIPVYRVFGVTMGIVIPLVVMMELGHTQSGEVLFLVLACLCLFVIQFFRRPHAQALTGIALTLFGILYVSWFLSFLIKMRFLYGGMLWVAYLLAVTKAGDIGAYLVGTPFGRHSLISHVSPKKTVEGMLGGLLASIAASAAFYRILPLRFSLEHLVVLGFLIGVVAQIGDLSESLMKRFCNAKDSGSVLPGMGGFLDAVDSILFTAPIFYFHLKLFM